MLVGEVLERRFRVERLLGSGTAAQVYRAVDLTDGTTVAMKVMRATSGELVTRFAREVRILQHLTHPALVRHIAGGTTLQGQPFVAMEWLPGEDLRLRLQRGALSLRDAIDICRRGAEGLAVAHAAGIVHRDLKPSNLFLVNGEPDATKVIDFGMASGPGDGLATETGMMLGTPAYMAPEQIVSARGVLPSADVFSLGCVLYECLTGQRAFGGGTVRDILDRITFDLLPRPSLFALHVPPELDLIVSRMTHKNPAKRPRDGAEVAAMLGSLRLSPLRAPSQTQITGDEKRIVCILVARSGDGSPPLAERPDCLTLARASLGEVVARTDGSLAVLFRADPAIDLAARAARCALALVEAVPEAMAIVTMGRETLGPSALGHDTLDLADGRLASALAHPETLEGRVRADEVAAGLLEVRFDLARDARGTFVRGERDPGQAARRILGKATPCVGRDRELKLLADLFDECVEERVARAVLVTGAAGIGKSRVRYEFLQSVAARGATWLGRGDPIRAGSPLGVLADVLRQVAGVRDGDAEHVTVARLQERVARSVVDPIQAARISEFLTEILRAPSATVDSVRPVSANSERPSERLRAARKNPQLMGDQMQEAWLEFVAAECETQPVVLVLEDMHWGDILTVRFVDLALRNLADRPFFVLALARPAIHELFPRLWSARDTQELKLHELSPKSSARLVRDALGSDVSASVLERMVQRAAGNAFYLEECVRAAADGDAEFPATVVAMLQARLERLEPEARQVLRAASVFGQTFWAKGAQALLGGDRQALLRSWLDLLEDREWIVRRATGKFPEHDEYMFRHSLLREGAYAMLTDEDRRVGHALAASWLESVGEQDAAVLAEHFERGGETEKSTSYYARAAVDSLRRNDLEGAIARAERGLAGAVSEETRALLHWAAAHALWWRGNLEDVARQALKAARGPLADGAKRWDAIGMIVGSLAQLGRHDEAVPWVEALFPAATGASDSGVSSARLAAMCGACIALLTAGRLDDADRLLDAAESNRARCADADVMLEAHLHRARAARALYVTGDLGIFLDEALATGASFERLGDARNACSARANAGLAYLMLGAYPLAERILRDALGVAHRIGIDRMGAVTEHNLGIAIARQGRTGEALAHELRAIDELHARSDQRVEGGAWTYVAQMRLQTGDVAGAEEAVRKALGLLEDFRPVRALAFATLGRVHLAKGESAEAMEAAGAARAILDALGALPGGEDSVRLVYARALDATGRTAEAREAIREASAQLTKRAEQIANPAWRESFLTNVAENGEIRAIAAAWERG